MGKVLRFHTIGVSNHGTLNTVQLGKVFFGLM
jgi:hypothetical protein